MDRTSKLSAHHSGWGNHNLILVQFYQNKKKEETCFCMIRSVNRVYEGNSNKLKELHNL